MPVHLSPPDAASLHPVSGVRIGVAEACIRKAGRKDLTVMLIDEGASVAACSRKTVFAPRPCRCAANTWRQEPGRTSAPWSLTRASFNHIF